MQQAQQLLEDTFKLREFRSGQQPIIEALLAGHSALAVFPTGGGKSLCYQLPALMLEGLTLVVSPLIALMKDQVDRLQALNIPAARLDSSVSADELQNIYRQLETGHIKLLYVAPERLSNERFRTRLQRLTICMMAVDEAHCVSEWGHNFRPDYLKLAALAGNLNVGRVLALTATATPAVGDQICDSFGINKANHIQTGFYRANLALTVSTNGGQPREQQLLAQLNARNSEPAIVYVTLQKTAETVAKYLVQHGYKSAPYHAGLKDEPRHQVQEDFMAGNIDVVVATIAFGMGIDKADIRAIYHYNLPKSLENYMQEIGRAGRDGGPAHCELLANTDDLTVLENFTFGDTPDDLALHQLIHWLLEQPPQFDIAVQELAYQFDVRPLVINTLLTYLELEGVISATAPFYTEYKVAFNQSMETALAQFDTARAEFLQRLFATGKTGRIWLTLRPIEAAQQLGEERQRILNALGYLEQQNLVNIKVAGVRQGYRIGKLPPSTNALVERVQTQFKQREQRDIQRLQQVCDWAQTRGCLQQTLVGYFGETLASDCGQCSGCLGNLATLPQRHQQPVDHSVIQTLRQEANDALKSPRQLARFLCGINSPRASRARLGKHRYFGAMAQSAFAEVLAACETQI
ncbi:RecQ family ATP-dependent DNA helicase [Teredinibacter franksiae]|uniref:RecQ family ATP-dependent DNA helicase n=1 Tax=Teredinibacter franksiae TaxID=2761453 RepID=UPI0016231AE2|nr:ATP-dependent DNA helicase RecQ [Teredinibacter franksiae]